MDHDMAAEEYLKIDDAAVAALEIFDSRTSIGNNRSGTGFLYNLYGVVNKCRTLAGKRLLKDWIKQPLVDVSRIKERYNVVEALNTADQCREELHRNMMRQIPDVAMLSRKLSQSRATLEDCYKLYRCVVALGTIIEMLVEASDDPSLSKLIITPLQRSAEELQAYNELIGNTISQDLMSGAYRIKPEVNEMLGELDNDLQRLKMKGEALLDALKREVEADNVKLESNNDIGFYFRVTLKSEKSVRAAKVKILDVKKGDGVRFTNSKLEALSGAYLELAGQYDSNQMELTRTVLQTSAGYVPCFETLNEHMALLDVLLSFSVLCNSSANPYVRPELYEAGTKVFELEECRHPVLECAPFAASFIPNDIKFEQGHRFVVLSGPNMGGKSTYLRSAALTVILAQIGCFVPCSSARFSIIDRILTRVGAEDYQYKGVSTFMAEMKDCKRILDTATSSSLVIIDELGRGTSTFDGFGLAWSIAEEIIKKGCFALFATHFHEMAALKHQHADIVQNLKIDTHCGDDGEMTILYKISEGVAEKSFGLSIARMVGFPDDVVKNAETMLEKLDAGDPKSAEEQAARDLFQRCSKMNVEEIRHTLMNT